MSFKKYIEQKPKSKKIVTEAYDNNQIQAKRGDVREAEEHWITFWDVYERSFDIDTAWKTMNSTGMDPKFLSKMGPKGKKELQKKFYYQFIQSVASSYGDQTAMDLVSGQHEESKEWTKLKGKEKET